MSLELNLIVREMAVPFVVKEKLGRFIEAGLILSVGDEGGWESNKSFR